MKPTRDEFIALTIAASDEEDLTPFTALMEWLREQMKKVIL